MNRRQMLSVLASMTTGGCLRLAGKEFHPEETTSADAKWRASDNATRTESPTETEANTMSSIELSKAWASFLNVRPQKRLGRPTLANGIAYVETYFAAVAVALNDGTIHWRTKIKDGDPGPDGLMGTVKDGNLYFTTRYPTIDSQPGVFYCLNISNGNVVSSREIGPLSGRPAVAGGHAIVGTHSNKNTTEQLIGVTTNELERVWSVTTESSYRDGLGYDGNAYIAIVGEPSQIQARDPATGNIIWAIEESAQAGMQIYDTALYVKVGYGHGDLIRVDPATGNITWRYSLSTSSGEKSSPYDVSPTLSDNRGYLPSGEQVQAVNLTTGETIWHVDMDTPVKAPAAVHDGIVWVVLEEPTSTGKGQLIGFDVATGERRIKYPLTVKPYQPFDFRDQLVVLKENGFTAYDVEVPA